MKHRLVNNGFGANAKVLLDNKGTINEEFADEAIEQFFDYWGGFDFSIRENHVSLGIEPTYQYDKLKIVTINKDKNYSTYATGKAWGPYGSQLVKREKMYASYKRQSAFTRFVDKWHTIIFPEGSSK